MFSIPFLDIHIARGKFGLIIARNVSDNQGRRVRVMQTGGAWQSATYLDKDLRFTPVFPYYESFDRMFATGFPVDRALMLGGGGYAYPKRFISTHPELRMDVVEIDPVVTEVARKLFFLDDLIEEHRAQERLNLITADARQFLESASAKMHTPYSAIVNDTFSGANPVASLSTIQAMQAAKSLLSDTGVYLTNVTSREQGSDISFLQNIVATLSEMFKSVAIIPCSDEDFGIEDNYLVMACDCALNLPDAIGYDESFLGTVLRD